MILLKNFYHHINKFLLLTSKRVVFNIKGNDYRLIVDVEYRLKLVFVVCFGTHKEYDLIDVKSISFKK